MSFLVAWISKISFMLERAVGAHGAGSVVRNIVAHIMTRELVRNHRLPRIITALVVGMRWGSRKKNIALGDIIHIVGKGGELS
jgi:ABC-type Fe3+-siderophore transport system permease subunit